MKKTIVGGGGGGVGCRWSVRQCFTYASVMFNIRYSRHNQMFVFLLS